jgi:hypothetical protein
MISMGASAVFASDVGSVWLLPAYLILALRLMNSLMIIHRGILEIMSQAFGFSSINGIRSRVPDMSPR